MDVVQELQTTAEHIMVVRYTSVATLALLIYEYAVTFDEEVRLIWPSRLSLGKTLFLLSRYLPFPTIILNFSVSVLLVNGQRICRHVATAAAMFECIILFLAEAIMFMRVYAIWDCRASIRIILSCAMALAMFGAFYADARFIGATTTVEGLKYSSGCLIIFPNRIIWVGMVVIMMCEFISLTLTCIRRFSGSLSLSTLSKVMYQDGVAYFVCVFLTSTVNLTIVFLAPSDLRYFAFITQAILHTTVCNRLLLRLRGAYESITVVTSSESVIVSVIPKQVQRISTYGTAK